MLFHIAWQIKLTDLQPALQILEAAGVLLAGSQTEDLPCAVSIDREGLYTVCADMRVTSCQPRDTLYQQIEQIADSCAECQGYLVRHDCGHDQNLPCSQLHRKEWT